ncbi:MAG TPA: LysR family transcriptional regulator [Kofleriaceae bacterium]
MESTHTWDDLRVLLALHRHHSFLAAGKALGVSTSTAARRIEALEESLGRSLVHRSSGGTSVEPDALELIALAEQLELGLRAVKRDDRAHDFAGTVRLSMAEGFVRPVTQVLAELHRKHPQLELEVVAEKRYVDLARREADIAIRNAKSSSPVVIDRTVGRLQFALYGSQAYVERRLRGGRLRLDDLARHDFIGHEGKMPQTEWLVKRGAKHFVFRSNSDFALQEATEQGLGICMLVEAAARAVPQLVRLDVDDELPSMPVLLSYHRELRTVPRVRLVLAALANAMRTAL